MNKLQFVALFAGLASTAVAMAQAPVKTDLVIDAVEWVYSGPRADRTGQVRINNGPSTGIVMKSPRLRVTVRNAGNKRWASSGRVEARVDMGAPGERAGRESNRTARTGVGVVTSTSQTSQSGLNVVSSPPFLGNAVIPGSLAPGEKRTVVITLKGKGKNSRASEHLAMALDKHYTAHVNIQSRGDDQQNNNRADLVFRLNASGSTIDPVLTQRETGHRGTVGVRAPGS